MPSHDGRALDRLGRILRSLDADRTTAPDAARLRKVVLSAAALWRDLFASETGMDGPVAPSASAAAAATAFGPCPDPGRDADGYRAWHAAQGGLFLHYAPIASGLRGRGGAAASAAGLIADALRLLGDHAAGLGRDDGRYGAEAPPAAPFAHLVQRTDRLGSCRSSDVNLGAVALALAVESGMRHTLGVPATTRLSMWRLFRALADPAADVRLTVELPVLVAAYNWASRHRGTGRRGYGWLNYLAADLLHPLLVPEKPLDFGLAGAPDALARLRAAALGGDAAASPAATVPSPARPLRPADGIAA